MKKTYVFPSVEAYLIDQSDVIATSGDPVADLGGGEYAILGSALFD